MEKYTALMEMSGNGITRQELIGFAVLWGGGLVVSDFYDWGKEKYSSHKKSRQLASTNSNNFNLS